NQYPCTLIDEKEIMIPYFHSRNTSYQIENEIIDQLKVYNNHSLSEVKKPPLSYLLTDGYFEVHELNTDKIFMNYTMSVNDHITRVYHRRNNFTRLDIRLRDFSFDSPELIIKHGYLQLLSMLDRSFMKDSLLKK